MLEELLPPPNEREPEFLLPPPNERELDELLLPPNEREPEELWPLPNERELDEFLLPPNEREPEELLPPLNERWVGLLFSTFGAMVFLPFVETLRLPLNLLSDRLLLGRVTVVRVLLCLFPFPNVRFPNCGLPLLLL